MKRLLLFVAALSSATFSSCSSAPDAKTLADGPAERRAPEASRASDLVLGAVFADTDDDGLPDARMPAAAGLVADPAVGEAPAPAAVAPPPAGAAARPEQKMIYSAGYQVEVARIEDAVATLLRRVDALGGYLSQRSDATLTVRVPATDFETLVAEVRTYGRVLSESVEALDVTSQHTDLTIRLENAERSRERLLALLEKATAVEDTLKIEEALRRLTTEIEQIKGQLKLLDNRVAFSTVRVAFQASASTTAPDGQRQSRFAWINRLGIEQDLRRFSP